jgi:hypothetical protein
MAQSGEGKPRVLIAGVRVAAVVPPARGAAGASFRSEVVQPMGPEVASLAVPTCLAGTAARRDHSGGGAQHGCR